MGGVRGVGVEPCKLGVACINTKMWGLMDALVMVGFRGQGGWEACKHGVACFNNKVGVEGHVHWWRVHQNVVI